MRPIHTREAEGSLSDHLSSHLEGCGPKSAELTKRLTLFSAAGPDGCPLDRAGHLAACSRCPCCFIIVHAPQHGMVSCEIYMQPCPVRLLTQLAGIQATLSQQAWCAAVCRHTQLHRPGVPVRALEVSGCKACHHAAGLKIVCDSRRDLQQAPPHGSPCWPRVHLS